MNVFLIFQDMGDSSNTVAVCNSRENALLLINYFLKTRNWTKREDYSILEYKVRSGTDTEEL